MKFLGLMIALGVAIAGYFIGAGLKELRADKNSISVRGLSERIVKANEAKLSLRYSVAATTVAEYSASVQKAQTEIRKYLSTQGFSDEEIQVGDVQMTDQMAAQYGSDNRKGPRYVGAGSIVVSTKNVDLAGKAKQSTSDLFNKGVPLAGSALKFFFTDLNSIKNEMLTDATSNAKTAAQSFADNTGVTLGKLRTASQGSFEIEDPLSDNQPSYDAYGTSQAPSSIMKKVRVVVSVEFATK